MCRRRSESSATDSLPEAEGIYSIVMGCACVFVRLVNTVTQNIHGGLTSYLVGDASYLVQVAYCFLCSLGSTESENFVECNNSRIATLLNVTLGM